MKTSLLTAIVLFLFLVSHAQERDKDPDPVFTPKVGLVFTTAPTQTITGTDTAFSSNLAMAPSFSLMHKSGLGIQYRPYYTTGSKSGIYLHSLSILYQQFGKENLDVEAAFVHQFFTHTTNVPYTPLSNEVYASASFKKLLLNPIVTSNLAFGKDNNNNPVTDFFAAAGVTHQFEWENETGFFSSINITPSLLAEGGTNSYFSFVTTSRYAGNGNRYKSIIKKKNKSKSKGRNTSSGQVITSTTSTAEASGFRVNNLELNVYSSFQASHFKLIPSASLLVPVTSAAGGATAYWQAELVYEF